MDQFHSNTIETSRKPGKHFTLDERGIIQALHQPGHSLRDIASIIGCAHTTIYNEIRRGTPNTKSNRGRRPQYTAKRGQKAYEEHRKNYRKPLKIYCDDCEPFIQRMVAQVREKRWSIDACIGYASRYNLFNAKQIPCARHFIICSGLENCPYPFSMYCRLLSVSHIAKGTVRISV